MEILQEFSGSTDQIIIKRKRTKRPHPSSSTSSSGIFVFVTAGNGGGTGEEFHNSVSISSPTASSTGLSSTTEEDEEDMAANCLILLARGGRVEDEKIKSTEKKNGNRKFTEMPTTTIGKVGIYVYQCKTCNRAFSSFQALGGHRASHKKPKLTADIIDRKKSPPINGKEEECGTGVSCKITVTPQLPNKIRSHENKEAKIHDCAVCGSEFGSGQALGGHMRRHRTAVVTSRNNNLKIGVISNIDAESSSHDANENAGNMFALDLNMPAETEEEDDRSEEKFDSSSDRQSRHVFSAAALVDCQFVTTR